MRRVAVFVDWQNCYHGARAAFHPATDPSRYGNVRLGAFAQLLAQKQSAADRLACVSVYRGEPDSRRDPRTHAAHMRQRQAWVDECHPDLLRIRTRRLRYLAGQPLGEAAEKGIDVQLAIDVMVMALRDEYELAVLATTDNDFLPVVEGLIALKEKTGKPDVAVIGWAGTNQKLDAGVPILWISRLDYETVRNREDFNLSAVDRTRPRS